MPTATMDSPQLSLWTIPEARSDREIRLALVFTHICILDSLPPRPGQLRTGCFVGNAKLRTLIGREDDSTVRRYLQELAECGLALRDVRHGIERTIKPLVTLADALRGGWRALAIAVLEYRGAPAPIKHLARLCLGKTRRGCDLKKLGLEDVPSQKTPQKRTAPARQFARSLPIKSDSEEATAGAFAYQNSGTGIREVSLPQPLPFDPAAASLFERNSGLIQPEAVGLARWAMKIGASVEQVRLSCAVLASRPQESISNRVGYLKSLVKAAVAGESVSFSVAPPSHPSDLGVRPAPRRVVDPEGEEKLRVEREAKKAEEARQKAAQSVLEEMSDAERGQLLEEGLRRLLESLPDGPMKERYRKAGTGHHLVQTRAIGILKERLRTGGTIE